MNITNYLPTIVRYAIVSLMASMFTRGWLSPEHNAILGENLDIIVSALVGLLTVAWALVKRPSAKAMEVAKEIDAQIPANQDVVIKTPGNAPDITVSAPGAEIMTAESYAGPGIWIRIQHRFGPRMMEWFLAGHTAFWGAVLLYSDDLFAQPSWAGFREIFGDATFLGWTMAGLGLLRIGGLIVNGARKNVTPTIRQVSAGIGFFIWCGITYGYWSSGVISTWLAIYPLFALGELVNINRAAHDQGKPGMENLDKLPLPLLIAFGLGLAVIFGVRHLGLLSGQRSTPSSSSSTAQVAAVIVDPAALNRATAAIEAQTMESINGRKSFERGLEALCRSVERLCEEVDDLKKELIRRGR